LGRIPVGFSIVLADKAFGQANDAEILVIVTALTLALTVDIPGGPMCSNVSLSVITFSGTVIVPLLVSRLTPVENDSGVHARWVNCCVSSSSNDIVK